MYDNGYIVKCRSILTNDICLSEASHKATFFLCALVTLHIPLKSVLIIWQCGKFVYTHTQLSRVNI